MANPLRRWSTAVYASVVFVRFGDFEEFGAGLRVDFPHFRHFGGERDKGILYVILRTERKSEKKTRFSAVIVASRVLV